MEFEFKKLSQKAIPKALERAERYRLLNQPDQAESICRDVLRTDPENQPALVMLILALTDQFQQGVSERFRRTQDLISRLQDRYLNLYYAGLMFERRARVQLEQRLPASSSAAFESFREAMSRYEEAEKIRPPGNDDAILRWNSCARVIQDRQLKPPKEDAFQPFLE